MVSIDRVYQTVLSIANKEGFNYVTPQEFNLLANQAQIELFEEYFQDQARSMLNPSMDGDYSDSVRNLDEKIHMFENEATLMEDASDLFNYPSNFYRLGRVTLNNIIVDEVSTKELSYVRLSPLTYPTRKQPVYHRQEGGFKVYPTELMDTDRVVLHYVRRPVNVLWTTDNTGVFSDNDSQDFELHASEFPELVVKVLGYIGILIKQQDIINFAQVQEQGIEQNEL